MLDRYVLQCFERRNGEFERYLVYHLGDRGFYAELTTVTRAMIYAWQHGLQLVLKSDEFAYRVDEGWADYFLPFCREYSPEMDPRVQLHARYGFKTEPRSLRGEALANAETVRGFETDQLRIRNVTIHGFQRIMKVMTAAIFRLSKPAEARVREMIDGLGLPERYVAVHIRRGDKVGDEDAHYPCELYMQQLPPLATGSGVFVMSDDARAVAEVRAHLRRRRIDAEVFSFCTDAHRGFDIGKVRNREPFFGGDGAATVGAAEYRQYVYDETLRLLAETVIAAAAATYVSTFRSNVGKVVSYLHPDSERCVLLTPEHLRAFEPRPPRPWETPSLSLRSEAVPSDLPPFGDRATAGRGTARRVQSMPVGERGGREFHLFYDLFVHHDRRKITAVAPCYGEDFDFAECGIDLRDITLEVDGLRIRGEYIPYGLDGWEPSVLFDFEHPALAEMIAQREELTVRVVAGETARTFRLDTRAPPAHSISLALCVKDENRWLGRYLDYYLDVLGVEHVYVYDNRTADGDELRSLLAPYVERQAVTCIPWDFEWRNVGDRKQIGQPPQESHTLACFGADRWIGFFDTDEFLRVPDDDLAGLLAGYDPAETGAVAFQIRWCMYKGTKAFEDIDDPLSEFVYVRDDPHGEKWKLFVSPQLVRFMRIHWIQEDRPTVHLPQIRYYHYFLRDFRFDEGKSGSGLGEVAVFDDSMKRVWERHVGAGPAVPSGPPSGAAGFVAHVDECFTRALRGESKLGDEVLGLDGMVGTLTRHLYNNLCAFEGARLLEIGSWKGASACSFLYGNRIRATLIDNWSEWGNHRDLYIENLQKFGEGSEIEVLEVDCWKVDPALLAKYNIYLYDGSHSEDDHYRAIRNFVRYLDDVAIVIIDDWNWAWVRKGAERALAELGSDVVYRREIILPEEDTADMPRHPGAATWWNGICVCVLARRS